MFVFLTGQKLTTHLLVKCLAHQDFVQYMGKLWSLLLLLFIIIIFIIIEILSSSQFLLCILSHIPAPSRSSEMQHLSENMCCYNKADIWVHPVIFDIPRFSCHFTKSFKSVLRAPITSGTTTTSTWHMHCTSKAGSSKPQSS